MSKKPVHVWIRFDDNSLEHFEVMPKPNKTYIGKSLRKVISTINGIERLLVLTALVWYDGMVLMVEKIRNGNT